MVFESGGGGRERESEERTREREFGAASFDRSRCLLALNRFFRPPFDSCPSLDQTRSCCRDGMQLAGSAQAERGIDVRMRAGEGGKAAARKRHQSPALNLDGPASSSIRIAVVEFRLVSEFRATQRTFRLALCSPVQRVNSIEFSKLSSSRGGGREEAACVRARGKRDELAETKGKKRQAEAFLFSLPLA